MTVNKKNGSVNILDLESDDSFGMADLSRLEEQYFNEPVALRELRRRREEALVERRVMNNVARRLPRMHDIPEFAERYRANEALRASLRKRININRIATGERLSGQAVNIIGREYSERAINSYVSGHTNDLEAQVAGSAQAWQGYASLNTQRENILNQMQGLRRESMQAAGEYIGKSGVNPIAAGTIFDNSNQMKDLAKQLIPITIAMQQLKQQGLDPQGRQRALVNIGDKAAGVLAYNKLEDEMHSGKGIGALSPIELRKKEQDAAEKLIKALEELRNSAGKTAEELTDLNKAAEDAAKEFEDAADARKIGGGGGGGRYSAVTTWGSIVGQAAQIIGNTIQTLGVSQPMAQMSNIAGYANIENQKYDMWRAGNEGDMTARLNTAGWANAKAFGARMRDNMQIAIGARTVGAAAAFVGGVAQTADAIASAPAGTATSKAGIKDPNTVQNIAGGVLAAGEGLSQTMIYGKDFLDKISQSQADIAGQLAAMDATKQLTHVQGYQAQKYRNLIMGLREGAQGLGGRADQFMDEAAGHGYLERMKAVGIGIKEMSQLTAFGAANIGSTFSPAMALTAQHFENRALGSATENMQRMAMFAGAGSQNPIESMTAALERAVGSGLDSSRALSMVAENTGQLVEQNYNRGSAFDVSDTASRLLVAGVDTQNTNREFAFKQAAESLKTEQGWRTNTKTSFAGMLNVSRLQKTLDLDTVSATILQGLPDATIAEWAKQAAGGNIEAVKRDMFNQGINTSTSKIFNQDANASTFFGNLRQGKFLSELERGGIGIGVGATQGWKQLQDWIGDDEARRRMFYGENEDLLNSADTPEYVRTEMLRIRQSIALQGGNPNQALRTMGVNLGWKGAARTPTPTAEFTPGAYGYSQRSYVLASQAEDTAAQEGMGPIGARRGSGLTGTMAEEWSAEQHYKQYGDRPEERFATAAAESAASFGEAAAQLNGASSKLTEAATLLIGAAGVSALNSSSITKQLNELKRQINLKERVKAVKQAVTNPNKLSDKELDEAFWGPEQ